MLLNQILSDAMQRAAAASKTVDNNHNFTSLMTEDVSSSPSRLRLHRSGSITISASPLNIASTSIDGAEQRDRESVPMSPSLADLASGPLY